MIHREYFVSLFLLIVLLPLSGQNTYRNGFDNNFASWGLGILVPLNDEIHSGKTNFTDSALKLYESPGKEEIGFIRKEAMEKTSGIINERIYIEYPDSTAEIPHTYLREVTYEGTCLKYYETENGYIRISPDKSHPLWIDESELEQAGYKKRSWYAHLKMLNTNFFPLPMGGINLRAEPSSGSQRQITIKEDRFLIKLTGNQEQKWFEVEIEEYEQHPCSGEKKLIQVWKGWIKAINDDEIPNLWYYTRGC